MRSGAASGANPSRPHGTGHGLDPVRPGLWRDPNLRIVYGVTLTVVMGVSSVAPAFPRIAEALGVSPARDRKSVV